MTADRRITATVTIAAFAVMIANAGAQDAGADLRFSTGVEYNTGEYGGTDDIEEIYIPLTFRAGFERVGLRLTVPWLSVTAPEDTVITDPGAEPLPGNGAAVTESGLGDVVGAVTLYDLYASDSGNFIIDATGKIKFATADEVKGLGTGENDYTLQLDAYRFFDRFSLQGSAGYRLRGDPPGVNLDDVFLASLGGAWLASERSSATV
jgi:hypothetical protein